MHPTLKRYIMRPPLRSIVGVFYNALIATELAGLRVGDCGAGYSACGVEKAPATGNWDGASLEVLTALIKTFERPYAVRRLIASLRRLYPDLKLLVVDDSRTPRPLPGAEWLILPFDAGVSIGRSAGLKQVETPFTLLLDDDFIFYRRSGLRAAFAALQRYPEIDIMGGKVLQLPHFHASDYRAAGLFPTAAQPVRPIGSMIGPFEVFDKVPNFYIARTERLRLVDWDSQIKRMDHADFFTRARGVLVSVYNPQLRCFHAQTPFDAHYMQHRLDFVADELLLRRRYYGDASSAPTDSE